MRHVKWKLGEMDEAQFYEEEFKEAQENEKQREAAIRNGMRKNLPEKREQVRLPQQQIIAKEANSAFNFIENFDKHFDNRTK